ncbi:MAG: putative toxin-antitoxin system toxin component, PIN family [archaeon]
MKVTTDTNVLVSGTFWKGDSDDIINIIDSGKIELILSEELIGEYNDVINRDEIIEKIEKKNLILNESVQKIIKDSTIVNPANSLDIIKEDPSDNIILECAIEGNVDYIITQDNHLLKIKEFKGIKIVTPSEFLKMVGKSKN